MKLFFGVLICFVTLSVPVVVLAGGGPSGFSGVVDSIEMRYHVHATRIPFLSLISFMGRKASHDSVSGLHLAEFQDITDDIDGSELHQIVQDKLGSDWGQGIRGTTRHGSEQTLIFMHPDGDRMALFIVEKGNRELSLVQVSVDPRHVDDDIVRYSRHHDSDQADSE